MPRDNIQLDVTYVQPSMISLMKGLLGHYEFAVRNLAVRNPFRATSQMNLTITSAWRHSSFREPARCSSRIFQAVSESFSRPLRMPIDLAMLSINLGGIENRNSYAALMLKLGDLVRRARVSNLIAHNTQSRLQ